VSQRLIAVVAFAIISIVCSTSDLFADLKISPPIKPWHVTQITVDTPVCDSSTTYSYNVTWKPVFETWNPNRAPSPWTHYLVRTYNCAETSIIICGPLCTTRTSGCSIKQATSWMRISTFLNDDETSKGSFMEISGIPRPPLRLVGKTWQCAAQ